MSIISHSVDFSANIIAGSGPLTVTFTPSILVILGVLSYTWYFGDGLKSTQRSPTHTYVSGGGFDVTLEVVFTTHDQGIVTKIDFINVFLVELFAYEISGRAPFTTKFYSTPYLPENVMIKSYDWNFDDGSEHVTGSNTAVHTFVNQGNYDVGLSNGLTGSFTGIEGCTEITSFISVSATIPQIKTSGMMTCLGWIKNFTVNDGDILIPLAVADPYKNVLETDGALRMEILREGLDYRLQYSGSKSVLIDRNVKIKINDGSWHFIGYESDDDGNMTFYVDSIIVPAESGIDSHGLPYSVAKSYSSRVGGGSVWSPYLHKKGQVIYLYNWRFGKGFNLGQKWIQELMEKDKKVLNID